MGGAPMWVVGAVASLLLVSQAFPNVLGPVSRGLASWADRRRQAVQAKDDADIAERDRQIRYLQQRLEVRQREDNERDRAAVRHRVWDLAAVDKYPDLGTPPSLWHAPADDSE